MVRIDSFESVFRAADKPVYAAALPRFSRGLIVTDLDEASGSAYGERVKGFLSAMTRRQEDFSWDVVTEREYGSTGELLELIATRGADLVCSYRHLGGERWRSEYTLGDVIETLTQAIPAPVLVLPHPAHRREALTRLQQANVVMALTDHLAGDSRLVNHAAAMVEDRGTLILSHVEDEQTFERYMDVISRLPAIDTDRARADIRDRLLREPRDFMRRCVESLSATRPELRVEMQVLMGCHLETYRELVEQQAVDLLVMNTKDEDQLAMHGLAYPIAVQIRDTPLLML